MSDRRAPAHSAGGVSRAAASAVVAGVFGASAVFGRRNAPDRSHPAIRTWYSQLDKPSWTPPDAVFGAVWPILEVGLGIGGYRLLRRPSSRPRTLALGLWLLNTGMVGGWSELFFRQRRLGACTAVSGAMIATSASYVAAASRTDRVAATIAVPFAAWLGFATLLAERVWRRNPDEDR